MNIFIKVAPRYYERLRGQIPNQSPAREAIDKATRIDHAVEGVLFEGSTFPVTKTKRASFSKQPSNPAPRLSATLRKSLGSPDATDRPPRRQERKMDGPKSVIPSECEGSKKDFSLRSK